MKLANSELKLTAEKNVRKNILDIYLVYPSGDREDLMSIRSNPYVFKLLRGYVGIHELKESLKKMVSSLSIRKYYKGEIVTVTENYKHLSRNICNSVNHLIAVAEDYIKFENHSMQLLIN